jgi:NAD(P)H-dependent flavin oxidoreductase YrpB (nitropropane dioxygenase family)
MYANSMPTLRIGDMEINPPIIQGGMGVRVSRGNLAAAVANEGCVGVIASAGLGRYENYPRTEFVKVNSEALRYEIRKARSMTNGALGVNIMVALSDYDALVRTAVDEKVDMIISGAGLPLSLPKYVDDTNIKLIPVVSSARAFRIICKRWKLSFDRLPDAIIVEGVKAGGHLGYTYQNALDDTTSGLEQTLGEVLKIANAFTPKIPVIAAGGIFDGADIARSLGLGVAGVQMATRFVCTDECDVHDNFKQAYLDARQEDITIIHSPVGLPGRVIVNDFVKRIKKGKTMPFKCAYHCLRSCEPAKAPYCIAEVLANAAEGKLDDSFAFAGANVWRCNEIIPTRLLIEKLVQEFTVETRRRSQMRGLVEHKM